MRTHQYGWVNRWAANDKQSGLNIMFLEKTPKSQAIPVFVQQLAQANTKLCITGSFVRRIHRSAADSSHTRPVMPKAFPWRDIIMLRIDNQVSHELTSSCAISYHIQSSHVAGQAP